ncbi:MAG: hypothetical protein AAF316_00425 [Cyanobacteria bacterium P01_A01_bin.80]
MSPVYNTLQKALNRLVNDGHTLDQAVEIMSQQYDELAETAEKALREKQNLEKALRDCQRKLRR